MYPRIVIDTKKLTHNLDFLNELCHSHGISTAIVTKVFCADKRITELVCESSADFVADSRLRNLASYPTQMRQKKLLLRISSPSEAEDVVSLADISLQSEAFTISRLNDCGKAHKVVLMIDLGDLREGIFFENEKEIYDTCEKTLACKNLELFGIGTNLTCYGGILPDKTNLTNLVAIADNIRRRYGIELPFVSGGNSSTIEFLKSGGVPKGITNLRLGESFVLGKDTAKCELVDGMYGDAFILEAELVEIKRKPSKPIGTSGRNAFGEEVHYEDKGELVRGILAIGRQDVDEGGIHCTQNNICVLGASSDHLLVDLTNNCEYNVSGILRFTMDYGAVLRGFTGSYVAKEYV